MSLTTNIISYWAMDEASGNAIDWAGSNTLTDHNSVGAGTGKINGARDFESSSSQYFTIADNASLSVGDIDFTFTCWVKLESKSGNMFIIGKSDNITTDNTIAYLLSYSLVSDTFRFVIGNGSSNGVVLSNNFGSPSTATWYFIVAWHDASANTVNIQVNNGTADSTSYSGGSYDEGGNFSLGTCYNSGSPFPLYYDGLMDEVGFWKRTLTTTERTTLYNSGNGVFYPFPQATGMYLFF